MNHYEILKVKTNATDDEIRSSFNHLLMEYYDNNRVHQLHNAYAILINHYERDLYDKRMRLGYTTGAPLFQYYGSYPHSKRSSLAMPPGCPQSKHQKILEDQKNPFIRSSFSTQNSYNQPQYQNDKIQYDQHQKMQNDLYRDALLKNQQLEEINSKINHSAKQDWQKKYLDLQELFNSEKKEYQQLKEKLLKLEEELKQLKEQP